MKEQTPELAKTEANKLLKLERFANIKLKNAERRVETQCGITASDISFAPKGTRGHKKDFDKSCRKTKLNRLREFPEE